MLENIAENITTWASYGLLGLFTSLLLAYSVYGWFEHKAIRKSKAQNIKYVRTPIHMLSVGMRTQFEKMEQNLVAKHGKVYGCSLHSSYTIVVSDPEIVQLICNKEFTKFPNRRMVELGDPLFQKFLGITRDEMWKRIRSIMTPALSTGKLKKIKYCIDDTCRTMVNNFDNTIDKSDSINIKQYVGAYTMDTIIQLAYGVKIDSLHDKNNAVIGNASKVLGTDLSIHDFIVFTLAFCAPKLSSKLKLRFKAKVMDFFEKLALDIITPKREELRKHGSIAKATSFIDLLLEAEHEAQNSGELNGLYNKKSNRYISNDEIISQCILFFVMGYDATATTIVNTLYLLATNPEAQEKTFTEVTEVLQKLAEESEAPSSDPYELVNFENLSRFKYLDAATQESMRLYPVATSTDRSASEDVHLESADGKVKFDVKKGDVIRIPIYSLHRDPVNFPDPESFKPERFLGQPTYPKSSYIPFGTGPRNCIARALAMLEAKMALLHLIREYRFKPCKETKLEFFSNPDLLVSKDIYLKVERR